jgi:hypothetical protein
LGDTQKYADNISEAMAASSPLADREKLHHGNSENETVADKPG